MTLNIKPLHPVFVAEITGVDLCEPLSDVAFQGIQDAMDTYAVAILPNQNLNDDQQMAFSSRFGSLEKTRQAHRPGYKHRLNLHVSDISNVDQDNKVVGPDDRRRMSGLANRLWHTDSSFKPTPAKYSMLSARAIPDAGGETQFADLRAAYDALPESKKREIEGLIAIHSIMHSREKIGFSDFTPEEQAAQPPVPQVIVRTHPGSGRKTLYLASHASEIIGMPLPEGRMLLLDLIDHATQPSFVYTHKWRLHDLVIWDDRCTMHRAREYDMSVPREMHRTTVGDIAPTVEQAKVA